MCRNLDENICIRQVKGVVTNLKEGTDINSSVGKYLEASYAVVANSDMSKLLLAV